MMEETAPTCASRLLAAERVTIAGTSPSSDHLNDVNEEKLLRFAMVYGKLSIAEKGDSGKRIEKGL
jgi:hypothetical protein